MRYLLDTNVLSEARRPRPDPQVTGWLSRQVPRDVAICVITVIEIELGVLRAERRDPAAGAALRRWFEKQVLTGFADRILSLDLAGARAAAPLHVPDPAPERDALIAAVALSRDLTVVTRNTADFVRTGARCLDPWTDSPPI
ncbi:MAG: type II toxin-antitoxin system VapC family toxin [Cellulomonas sp.]|nr:type II toxin-antitoxin system VapC family toxin [Cellulomonas sp.]